jgi:hypothetical protein
MQAAAGDEHQRVLGFANGKRGSQQMRVLRWARWNFYRLASAQSVRQRTQAGNQAYSQAQAGQPPRPRGFPAFG